MSLNKGSSSLRFDKENIAGIDNGCDVDNEDEQQDDTDYDDARR